MDESQTKVIKTEIPIGLLEQANNLVEAGWFRSFDDLMLTPSAGSWNPIERD